LLTFSNEKPIVAEGIALLLSELRRNMKCPSEGQLSLMLRIVLALVWLIAIPACAWPQSTSAPSYGGVGISAPADTPMFGASTGTQMLRHRSPTGSPCLEVGGFARAHTTVSNLYDHVIAVKNNCAQQISIQVCYYNTQNCLPVEIPGGERKEAILGTMPATRDFRFEFREKF
jgi:hypothetical protein